MPNIPPEIALAGCFVCSAVYAVALTTQWGQEKTLSHVWIAGFVVFGVGLVLVWLYLVYPVAAMQALVLFVAGGLPMLIRATYLWNRHKQQYIAHLQQRAQSAGVQEFED